MHQVFSQLICEQYIEKGVPGILLLWLPLLTDWVWTVAHQWMSHPNNERRYTMNTAFDRQLSDLFWSVATGLHAGYDLRTVFEVLSKGAPEPAALVAKAFVDEINQGADLKTALARMQRAYSSPFLDRLITVILEQQQTGLNLGDALETLSDEILSECGSDPAFYAFMRDEARQLGATVPERANQ